MLKEVRLPEPSWAFHPGQSYRNLLIVRDAGVRAADVELFEPHMHQREPIWKIDALILAPVLRFLEERHAGDFAEVVCGDHKTSSLDGLHGDAPPLYLLYRDFARLTPPTDGRVPFRESMPGRVSIPSIS